MKRLSNNLRKARFRPLPRCGRRAALIGLHAAVYGGVAAALGAAPGWAAVALGGLLIWISVADIERCEIPDTASLALLCVGAVWLALGRGGPVPDHIVGAIFWPILFWGVARCYKRVRGRDGLGFGDVKLMAGLGLWLGFADATVAVMAAAVAGAASILAAAILRRSPLDEIGASAIAFGPFLCLSAWAMWLLG